MFAAIRRLRPSLRSPGIIMALVGRGRSAPVQAGKLQKTSQREGPRKMLAFGWLVVLLGVLAIQRADGRLPFIASL
jgi:hypothetical protein